MDLHKLPDELILKIIEFSTPCRIRVDDKKHLSSCCLVCRQWLRIAQPLLFEEVDLIENHNLPRFHQSLGSSKKLAGYVRRLEVGEPYESGVLDATRLIEDCLEMTTELTKLAIGELGPRYCFPTSPILHRICRLPNLKSLILGCHGSESRKRMDSFKPEILLQLPKTVRKLAIVDGSEDLLRLLPEICAELQNPRLSTYAHQAGLPASFPGIEEQETRVPGLRELTLVYEDAHLCKFFPAIGYSAPMLTVLELEGVWFEEDDTTSRSILGDFLKATPLLERLDVCVMYSSIHFEPLPPLSQLRSLELSIGPMSPKEGEPEFCHPLANFISHSEHLVSFTIYYVNPWVDLSHLIDGVITSTTKNGAFSTLENLRVMSPEGLPIEGLEHLCRSAPLLETLELTHFLPHEHLPRAAAAIGKLKNLLSIELKDHLISCRVSDARYIGDAPIDVAKLMANMEESRRQLW